MMEELFHLLNILLAVVLGFAIGYERKLRYKEAGIRTHTIVCAGSALIMVVSKYGFGDSIEADASRVAAQIVSGIGFLGAGIIIYRKHEIHGLTTAAGVWATSGVGMAAGAGMYIVAAGGDRRSHRRAVYLPYQVQVFSDEKVFSGEDLFRERRLCKRYHKRTFSDGPLLSPYHRAQGRRDGVPCHAQYGQGVFLAAAWRDHGGTSFCPLHRTLRRDISNDQKFK